MKNLFNFTSFIDSINESENETMTVMGPFDPTVFKKTMEELLKSRGGSGKEKSPAGLAFSNIKSVFGDITYPTRFMIAQALKLSGKDLFPTNSVYPNVDENKKKSDEDKIFMTFYIGDKEQNFLLEKVSKALLSSVKDVVMNMKEKGLETYIKPESVSLPDVKLSRVKASSIKA